MNNEITFHLTGNLALLAWLLLSIGLFLPQGNVWRDRLLLVSGRWIALFLAAAFIWRVIANWGFEPKGDLFSLEGLLMHLSIPERSLDIFVEVLFYDLLMGRWIVDDALDNKINPLLLLPILILTFMLGPFGLIAYLILRTTPQVTRANPRPI